jgi:F-type H+-transporting ATPase subunit b
MTSLRRDVSDLALNLAGKVVGETLSDDARAKATVDRFISELEAQAAK